MSWGDDVAATYRGARTAEALVISTNGTPTTYADCQVVHDSRDLVLQDGTRAVARFLRIHIPATAGVVAPAENSSLTWNGKSYTTSEPEVGHGFFRVEATS